MYIMHSSHFMTWGTLGVNDVLPCLLVFVQQHVGSQGSYGGQQAHKSHTEACEERRPLYREAAVAAQVPGGIERLTPGGGGGEEVNNSSDGFILSCLLGRTQEFETTTATHSHRGPSCLYTLHSPWL